VNAELSVWIKQASIGDDGNDLIGRGVKNVWCSVSGILIGIVRRKKSGMEFLKKKRTMQLLEFGRVCEQEIGRINKRRKKQRKKGKKKNTKRQTSSGVGQDGNDDV